MVIADYDVRALDASARAAAEFWKRFAPMAEELAIQGVRRHFETESSPDGAKWAPLKDSTFRISVLQAIKKLGGKAAFPIVKTNEYGGATAYARTPVEGKQKSAVVRRTKRAHKILQDTRRLYGSIMGRGRDSVRALQEDSLTIGTRAPYAAAHQFGDAERNLPARPFMGFSERTRREIEDAANKVLEG